MLGSITMFHAGDMSTEQEGGRDMFCVLCLIPSSAHEQLLSSKPVHDCGFAATIPSTHCLQRGCPRMRKKERVLNYKLSQIVC